MAIAYVGGQPAIRDSDFAVRRLRKRLQRICQDVVVEEKKGDIVILVSFFDPRRQHHHLMKCHKVLVASKALLGHHRWILKHVAPQPTEKNLIGVLAG